MRRRLTAIFATVCLAALAAAAPAQGAFGIHDFAIAPVEADGSAATQAGSHPFALETILGANFEEVTLGPEGWLRDFLARTPEGLVGDTTAYLPCTTAQFLEPFGGEASIPNCPPESQVGAAGVALKSNPESTDLDWVAQPIFTVTPPPGVLLRLGFRTITQNTFIDVTLSPDAPYNPIAFQRNTPQVVEVLGAKIQLWGHPADPVHNEQRRGCGPDIDPLTSPADIEDIEFMPTGKTTCKVAENPKPFLTLPTQCEEPLFSSFEARSWEGAIDTGSATTDPLKGCSKLNYKPSIGARPTNQAASSPTGLDFNLEFSDEGLISAKPGATAQSHTEAVEVALPEGMTINPSQAEGLAACSENDLKDETLAAEPGEGCPQASKVGTLAVESPLVSETIDGSLFVAEPHANLADDSLIAVYAVFKNRDLGVIVKQPIRVEPDPKTGQLIATTEEIPQLPFSRFHLHFREGGRSPLVTPPSCDSDPSSPGNNPYVVEALLYPWSGGEPAFATSSFEVTAGPGGGPCPPGGTPPFQPGFEAGSQSNAAGAYSPFTMRLTRRDGDQDLTRFDATLPPGVLARLAGVDRCPDAQIALAKAKTGKAELSSPSCPLNSRIGGVLAGAGVGSQLTYVPGTVYLAGPFAGAPLSAVAIVPAVAGPFDVGTVVYRQALRVNPRTGIVTADGDSSDPLPHILAGIPLVVRDIQVRIDRSAFTLNPTSCDPTATAASLWGGGANPFSLLDNSPVAKEARYQAASCQSLGFKPRLELKLKGGTHRGDNPALRATFRPRPGDANNSRLALRFPRSAFIDQAHFRTICTRVQFVADACPQAAIYGKVRAFTPLLSEPLEGPAYLRSSDNELPDLVFDLHGLIDFEAVVTVDSIKGGLRTIVDGIPDAPITKVVVDMQGGAKGLFVNSTNLCAKTNRAALRLTAHNGKRLEAKPPVQPRCHKKRKRRD
jgi:hypothetical protein